MTTNHYKVHLAIVRHNTNFATVHSGVTVGGCSVEYEYKLLQHGSSSIVRIEALLWSQLKLYWEQGYCSSTIAGIEDSLRSYTIVAPLGMKLYYSEN